MAKKTFRLFLLLALLLPAKKHFAQLQFTQHSESYTTPGREMQIDLIFFTGGSPLSKMLNDTIIAFVQQHSKTPPFDTTRLPGDTAFHAIGCEVVRNTPALLSFTIEQYWEASRNDPETFLGVTCFNVDVKAKRLVSKHELFSPDSLEKLANAFKSSPGIWPEKDGSLAVLKDVCLEDDSVSFVFSWSKPGRPTASVEVGMPDKDAAEHMTKKQKRLLARLRED